MAELGTGLFSSLRDQPFNTITSASESGSVEVGQQAAGTAPDAPTSSGPLQNILSAMMHSNAAVQGQEQAKKVLKEQAAVKPPVVTLEANPNGGPPLVTIKKISAEALNPGQQQNDVEQAFTTPRKQVEEKLAKADAAPTAPPPASHPIEQAASFGDQSLGYRQPRPWDTDIAEKVKTEAGLRVIAAQMGFPDPKATAHATWKRIQRGETTIEKVTQNIANFRAQQITQNAKRFQDVVEGQQKVADASLAGQREEDAKRRIVNQEHRAVIERKTAIAKQIDFAAIPVTDSSNPQEWLDAYTAEDDTGVPATDYEKKQVISIAKNQVNSAFDKFLKDKDTLSTFPTLADAEKSFGQPLSDKQKTTLEANRSAARNAWVNADTRTKQALEAQRLEISVRQQEIAKNAESMRIAREMALADSPDAIKSYTERVLSDPDAFTVLEEKTPEQKLFKSRVESQLRSQGFRAPSKLPAPDVQRLETVQQGRADVKWMRDTVQQWNQRGVPLVGVFRGRLLNAVTEGAPSSVLAKIAVQEVPGFSRLSQPEREAYIETAATMYHRTLSLTAREVKSNMSGRPSERIFEFFKSATPSIARDPSSLNGLFNGVDAEFANAESAIRSQQWGGKIPTAQGEMSVSDFEKWKASKRP